MSSAKLRRRDGLKPKLIALSVAACFGVSATQTVANPTGGSVASGSASFASSGNTLTITNTANAIINWQNFSIGVNEITRFVQSGSSSAVLNRVVGANGSIPQSKIDGLLQSVLANGSVGGRVFLLNPSGIAIGKTGRIDVSGFVASSLNLSDTDFLNGKMRFTATPGAGAVTNAGTIDTSLAGPGGRVWLVGPDVQNSGIIRSPQGEIILAAGKSVELVSEGSPFVTVNITADSGQALNLGQLIADSGRIGMFGALVRQSGVAQADSAIVGANGEIRLVATKDLTLDAGSRTTANGPSGGTVTLQAQGGTSLVYGTVEAKGSSGQGGTIAALGVRVGVLGNGVIDASGEAGGGTVLVGGDQHGANPSVQNAQQTLIGPDGIIRADAATTGDGGRVVVWSDAYTQVYGTVSARGGARSGNGGFVETSSAGGMDLSGVRVDTRAPNGRWGTWLLDPANVYLEANTYAGGGDPLASAATFGTNPGTDAHITEATVESGFNTNGTVRIQATNDVNFRTNLTLQYGTPNAGLFEVRAQNNINLAADGVAHTITTNGHDVVLSANDVGPYGAAPGLSLTGTGSITGGGNVFTDYGGAAGGNIVLSGYGVIVGTLETIGGVNPNGAPIGSVTITALNGGVKTGSITTRGANGADLIAANFIPPTAGLAGGAVNITAGYGTITTGAIDTTGGRGGNGGTVTGQAYAGANGGAGGAVTVGTTSYGQTASINVASITTIGGVGGYGGSGATINTTASSLDEGRGGDGGSGGSVALSANTVTASGAIKTTGGAGGAGGNNNNVTLTGVSGTTSSSGFLTVGFGGGGGFGGSVSVSGNGANLGPITTTGGAGGAAGSGNSATVIVNAVVGNTQVSGEADSGFGGSAGFGGQVSLAVMGPTSVAGSIDTSGGVAAAGGANSVAKIGVYGLTIATFAAGTAKAGEGGGGNGAGTVLVGGSTVTAGNITAAASAGAVGGANSNASAYGSSLIAVGSSFQTDAEAGIGGGGAGGSPGRTQVQLSGGDIATGAIVTTGGAGGAGSTGSTATASGYAASSFATANFNENGLGESGGSVVISAGTGNINIASFDTTGDGAGSVSISNVSGNITTGTITTRTLSPAFSGGGVSITTSYGRILVNGNIDARGSDGLTRFIDTCGDGCRGATYGGSSGGVVTLTRNGAGDPIGGAAIQVTGSVLTSGGNGIASPGTGGAGGSGGGVAITSIYGGAFYGAVITGLIDARAGNGAGGATGFSGGAGGVGGAVGLQGATVQVGDIKVSGGSGGAAGASGPNGPGASGAGGNAGDIALSAYGNVTTGNIFATGGDGGNGAATTLVAGLGSAGGYGGVGGTFVVNTNLVPTAFVATGAINVSGGRGGNGGDSPTGAGGAGGLGGGAGTVIIDPNSATIGAITGTGGAGGAGGYGATGALGGSGGVGATVTISGIAYGGKMAVGTIDLSGGAGGNGGGSGGAVTLGGSGGAGGVGGTVDILGGSIDLTSASSIKASGGAGGAGGSGTAGFGGAGGNGGAGGSIDLSVPSQTSANGGPILVLSSLSLSYGGGVGGIGGATGGANGVSGATGSGAVLGEITIVSPTLGLDGSTVIQGTQQAANINANNAPPSDDQKKDKDKKSNQVAACK